MLATDLKRQLSVGANGVWSFGQKLTQAPRERHSSQSSLGTVEMNNGYPSGEAGTGVRIPYHAPLLNAQLNRQVAVIRPKRERAYANTDR